MVRLGFLKTIGLITICFLALSAIGPLARAQEDWKEGAPLDPHYIERLAEETGKDPAALAQMTIDELLRFAEEFLSEQEFIALKLGLWGVDEERAQEIADILGLSLYEMCKKSRDNLYMMASDKQKNDIADEIKGWGADAIVITPEGDDGVSDSRVIHLWFHNTFTRFGVQINKITIQKVTTTTEGTYKYQSWDPTLNNGDGGYKTEEGEGINRSTQYSITYYTWDGALKEVAKQTVSDSKSFKREEDGSLTLHVHSIQNTTQVSQYRDGALVGGTTSGTYVTYQNMLRTVDDTVPEMLKVSEGTISGASHVLYNQLTPTWMRQEGWTYRYDKDEPQGVEDMATLNYTWYKYTDVTLQDGTTKTVNNGTISYSFSMQWAEFSTNPNWDHWVTFSGPNVTGGVLGNVWLDYINDFNKPAGTFDFSFTIIRTELTYGGYDGNGNATSIHQHQDGIMYSPNQGDASWQHLVNYWFVPGDGYPLYIKEDGGCWTNQAWGTNRDPSIVPDKEPPADAQYSVDSRVDNTRFSGQDGYLNASDFFKALWGEGNTDSLEYVGQFTDKIAREYQVEAEGIYWLLMRWGNPDSADIRSHYDVRIWLDADTLGLDYDEEGYWQVEGMMQTDDGEWVLRLRCANGMRGSLIFLTMDELVEAYGGKVKVFYNRPQIYWEDFNNFEGWDG